MARALKVDTPQRHATRTNIVIDDELMEKAMQLYKTSSKRHVVELALRHLVGEPMTREEALAMEGTGWGGDLDAMRSGDPVIEI